MNVRSNPVNVPSRAIVLAFALTTLSSVAASGASDPGAGRTTYLERCAGCHGTDGRGTPSMQALLKTKIPDLTKLKVANEADLIDLLMNGKSPMPGFHYDSTERDLREVAHYVMKLIAKAK